MQKKKTKEAKKVIEVFRVLADRKLDSSEKRDAEDKLKIYIKELINGKV